MPFIVSFGSFIDETSALADLILPDHSFLESWVDAAPESGSAKAVPAKFGPVMRPLYDTRSTPDVLLEVSRGLAKPIAGLPNTFEEFLNAEPTPVRRRRALQSRPPAPRRWARQVPPYVTADPLFDGEASQYPYHFMPYASQGLYDGSLAHLPWLQEMPDPMTSGMWCSWVEINEKKAEELGIAAGRPDRGHLDAGQPARAGVSESRASRRMRWRCRWGRATPTSRATRPIAA